MLIGIAFLNIGSSLTQICGMAGMLVRLLFCMLCSSLFNPVRYPDRCRDRRNVVLGQMLKAGYLSKADYEKLTTEPLVLDFHRTDHKEGAAPYFREFLRMYMSAKRPNRSDYPSWNQNQYVIDSIAWVSDPLYGWCNKNFKKDGSTCDRYLKE